MALDEIKVMLGERAGTEYGIGVEYVLEALTLPFNNSYFDADNAEDAVLENRFHKDSIGTITIPEDHQYIVSGMIHLTDDIIIEGTLVVL